MVNECPELKDIFVFYNFAMNGFDLSKTKEKWRCSYYQRLFNIPYQTDIFRKNDINKLDKFFKKQKLTVQNDFYGYYEPNIYPYKDGVLRVKGHIKNFLRNDYGLIWLKKMQELAIENNQNLYVVIPPFSKEFLQYLDKKYYNMAIDKLSDIVSKEFILDFLYDDYDIDDFGDTDHFTKKGAVKFSKKLNEVINQRRNMIK